ncbi:MAG: GspH/FimT family pseudopilin [Phycisphaerae bacterium]
MTWTTGHRNNPSAAAAAFGRPAGQRARTAAGFTLIELILVMVVISVVLALSAPSLHGFFASRQIADSARGMLSLMQWAQSQAIAQGSRCRLNIDAPSGTYWLTVEQAGGFVEPNQELGRQFRVPAGATVSLQSNATDPSASYVQFYPSGRSDVAVIEIRGSRGEVYQIACSSATERFQITSPSETR